VNIMPTTPQIFSAPIRQQYAITPLTDGKLFSIGDAAQYCRRSPSWIRRLAAELRIEAQRTGTGQRIFNSQQVQRLSAEVARRELEALKR